jgi:glycerol-3-phosphate dehydrogenase
LLAQEVLQRLEPALGAHAPPWTAHAPLPGGDLPQGSLEAYQAVLSTRYPGMPHPLLDRYAHAYGTLSTRILGHAATPADLGREIAPDVFEAELRYLHDQEWARTGEDVLWRRSKLGLHLAPVQCAAVAQWMQGYAAESQAMADRP